MNKYSQPKQSQEGWVLEIVRIRPTWRSLKLLPWIPDRLIQLALTEVAKTEWIGLFVETYRSYDERHLCVSSSRSLF